MYCGRGLECQECSVGVALSVRNVVWAWLGVLII